MRDVINLVFLSFCIVGTAMYHVTPGWAKHVTYEKSLGKSLIMMMVVTSLRFFFKFCSTEEKKNNKILLFIMKIYFQHKIM